MPAVGEAAEHVICWRILRSIQLTGDYFFNSSLSARICFASEATMTFLSSGFAAALLLFSATAKADPSAIKIDADLKMRPDVQALILEYHKIAAAKPDPCNDQKYFGLRTVRVDGVKRVRYYVDGKGIACIPSRLKPNEVWRVTRNEWTSGLWNEYQNFVQSIGLAVEQGRCATVDACMISTANPLRTATDEAAFHYSDCADFPYYLRSYFSFRKGLPFSFALTMRARSLTASDQKVIDKREARARELEDKQRRGVQLTQGEDLELKGLLKARKLRYDPRYSVNGNWVAKRSWILPGTQVSFFRWVTQMQNVISTASMRVWRNEGERAQAQNGERLEEQEPDFYSPALTPQAIMPGTVVYKHDGHTAVVYRIERSTGKIYYIDAHPDNTLTWGVIDETWTRNMGGRPELGGGFKNFRPIISESSFFGSRQYRMVTDRELENGYFSSEQYKLFDDPKAKARYRDRKFSANVDYLDFLRLRMSDGSYRLDPVEQFKDDISRICKNMQYRREAVLEATEKNFHLQDHPARLPDNIYGAQGEWERYSSPGRDVLFKQRVVTVIENLTKYRGLMAEKHPLLKPGMTLQRLKADALRTWEEEAGNCRISYRASNGEDRSFNLIESIRRVPYMSYDPYMCPELRFGATSAQELATCTDSPEKREWHTYQQFLRNHMTKNSTEAMGWSLPELKSINRTKVDPKVVEQLDVVGAVQRL